MSVSDDFPSASTVWHRTIKSTVCKTLTHSLAVFYTLLYIDNPDITFQCVRRLENDKFAIYTTVNISQYLAYEHVIVKIVLLPVRVEYSDPSKTGVSNREHKQLKDVSVEVSKVSLQY